MFKIIILVIIVAWFFARRKKAKKHAVDIKCTTEKGNFSIQGSKERYVIKKGINYEFLVEDGKVVACKDKRKTQKFVYYQEEN